MYTSKSVAIRVVTTVGFVALLAVAPALGQVAVPTPHPYGLDPYAPSDAAWLRNYGAALVAQTPLLELGRLDPYKPSHAALLRQLGGAIPLCCPDWYWPGPSFAPLTPSATHGVTMLRTARFSIVPRATVIVGLMPPAGGGTAGAPTAGSQPASTPVATAIGPEDNDGIWIRYAGQIWTSAGRAVPLQESEFERVGEYAGFPVYRRARANDGVIYVPTRKDLVAPYRLKP